MSAWLIQSFRQSLALFCWWQLTHSAALGKSMIEAIQESGAGSASDSQGFVWMVVCVGLLAIVAGSLIVATIGLSHRKKKPDSGK